MMDGTIFLISNRYLLHSILHPDRSKLVLDILCSRRQRPIFSSSPDSTNNTTVTDNASSISSSTTASLDPPPPQQRPQQQPELQEHPHPVHSSNPDPSDYTLNPSIDTEYCLDHARLDHAIIIKPYLLVSILVRRIDNYSGMFRAGRRRFIFAGNCANHSLLIKRSYVSESLVPNNHSLVDYPVS
jgi:hypothetical protein